MPYREEKGRRIERERYTVGCPEGERQGQVAGGGREFRR